MQLKVFVFWGLKAKVICHLVERGFSGLTDSVCYGLITTRICEGRRRPYHQVIHLNLVKQKIRFKCFSLLMCMYRTPPFFYLKKKKKSVGEFYTSSFSYPLVTEDVTLACHKVSPLNDAWIRISRRYFHFNVRCGKEWKWTLPFCSARTRDLGICTDFRTHTQARIYIHTQTHIHSHTHCICNSCFDQSSV